MYNFDTKLEGISKMKNFDSKMEDLCYEIKELKEENKDLKKDLKLLLNQFAKF